MRAEGAWNKTQGEKKKTRTQRDNELPELGVTDRMELRVSVK